MKRLGVNVVMYTIIWLILKSVYFIITKDINNLFIDVLTDGKLVLIQLYLDLTFVFTLILGGEFNLAKIQFMEFILHIVENYWIEIVAFMITIFITIKEINSNRNIGDKIYPQNTNISNK